MNVHVVFLLVLFSLGSSYSLIAHTSRGSRCPRVCLISSMHEVGVHSSTLSSPFHPTSSSHSSSISSSSCCPPTSTRLSSKIPCATSPRRWGRLTSPSPTQVMSQGLLPHGDLCRVPHRVPDPPTVLRATVPRGCGLR